MYLYLKSCMIGEMMQISHARRKMILWCCMMLAVLQVAAQHTVVVSQESQDSTQKNVPYTEFSTVHKNKKVSSRYPVVIRKKGSSLMVTSKNVQLLPVYKANGRFFGMFHLTKGTNWICGLPKGNYLINDVRISIL